MIQREHILNDGTTSYIIKANDGCKFVRKSDGVDFGNEIWLGYRFDNGNKVLEVPSDFEEVLDTEEINIDQI